MSVKQLPRWLTVSISVVLVLSLLAGGYLLARDSSLTEVRDVTVEGAAGTQADEIVRRLERAGLGMSSLRPDVGKLRAAVDDIPTVRSVSADGQPLHGLLITVEEERPIAALQSGSQRVAVSAGGSVLPGVPTVGLPVVPTRGELTRDSALRPDAKLVLRALGLAPRELRSRVRFGGVGRENGLSFQLENGVTLRFGDRERLRAKWLAAQGVLADPEAAEATYIDLRAPDRPAVGGIAAPNPVGADVPATTSTPAQDPAAVATNPQATVQP